MESINFESLSEHYIGCSEDEVLNDWENELSKWKEYGFDSIHILVNYLKFSDLVQTMFKKEMFPVDKSIMKEWIGNAFTKKINYRNLKDVNIFNIRDFYSFNFSKDFVDVLKDYGLSTKSSDFSLRTLLLSVDSVNKYYDSSFYQDIFQKHDVFNNPQPIIDVMALMKRKSELKDFFRVVENLNINVDWEKKINSKTFIKPVSNLNQVFISYLKNGANQEDEDFSFYMDKRNQLLNNQSKLDLKEDLKFFLATSRAKREESIISFLKDWPKVTLTKEDMQEKITHKNSLENLLLAKRNWRVLQKYSSLLSITDSQILSSSVKYADVRLSRTTTAIISLLEKSKDNNDWYQFINSFLNGKNKTTDIMIIEHLISSSTTSSSSDKIRHGVKEYLQDRNYEAQELKNMWEDFHLLSLDKLSKEQWKQGDDESLIQKYIKEHINLIGVESYSVFNGKGSFLAKTSLEKIATTSFKEILSALSSEDKQSLIVNIGNYWEDHDAMFYESFINKVITNNFINEDTVALSDTLKKLESFIMWMNPSYDLESEISQLEIKLKKYKDMLRQSLDAKTTGYSFGDRKNYIISSMDEQSILWEDMRMNMLIPRGRNSDSKPMKF